jgi:hypothetical protein
MTLKKINTLFQIFFISILFRLLISIPLYKNTFPNSIITLPLDADSYYYYYMFSIVPKFILFILPLIAVGLGCVLLYLFLENLHNAKIITMLFSVFNPFVIQTYAGLVDTNSFIFLAVMVCLYTIKKGFTLINSLLLIIITFLVSMVWVHILILNSFLLSLYLIIFTKLRFIILPFFILIISVILFKLKFFFLEMNKVAELQPNLSWVWLCLMIIYLIFLFDNFNTKHLYIKILSTGSVLLCYFQQRWTYLGVLFIWIMLAIWYNDYKDKRKVVLSILMVVLVLLSTISLSMFFLRAESLVTTSELIALSSIDKEIIGSWGYGHLYNYATDGKAKFKGHPSKEDYYWNEILKHNFTNVSLIRGDCIIVVSPKELKKYKTSISSLDYYSYGRYNVGNCIE